MAALRRVGCRGVLARGWAALAGTGDNNEDPVVVDELPHDWLFGRMAAVVHHGGAGTTPTGLRAGIPNTVVPFFTDQPFWAGRVAALGVGPSPIPRQALTMDRLAAAIHTASRGRGHPRRPGRPASPRPGSASTGGDHGAPT